MLVVQKTILGDVSRLKYSVALAFALCCSRPTVHTSRAVYVFSAHVVVVIKNT